MRCMPDTPDFRAEAERKADEREWHPDVAVDPFAFHGLAGVELFASVSPMLYAPKSFVAIRIGARLFGVDFDGDGYAIKWGWIFLRPWYRFDGASGPAIDGVGNMLAAAIHDATHDAAKRKCAGVSYAVSDSIYRDVCLSQGAGAFRAWNHWFWLRTCGWAYRLLG